MATLTHSVNRGHCGEESVVTRQRSQEKHLNTGVCSAVTEWVKPCPRVINGVKKKDSRCPSYPYIPIDVTSRITKEDLSLFLSASGMEARDLCLYLTRGILMDHQRNILYYVCRTHCRHCGHTDRPRHREGRGSGDMMSARVERKYQQGTFSDKSYAS